MDARRPIRTAAIDGVIYLAMGATGDYDPTTKSGRKCWYCKFKAETLEQIGEPFFVDHGDDSICGSQNMTTDGRYIYASHYTDDEAARTPNVVVHDKDSFKVVAKHRFGWNHGIDVVPGGKDGAVRFAWVFTPNWREGTTIELRVRGSDGSTSLSFILCTRSAQRAR